MSDGHPVYGVFIFLLFIITNVILYGFGAACQAVNDNLIEERAKEGDKKSIKIIKLISNPSKLINVIHMATIIMNMIAGVWIIGIISSGIGIAMSVQSTVWLRCTIAIVLIVILAVFGIFVPKKIAIRNSIKWVYSLYGIISVLLVVLSPMIYVITKVSNGVLIMIGIDPSDNGDNVTEEEIIDIVNEGHEQGVLLASEAEMITNIVEFGDKEAQDIMTHRKNIIAIDGNCTINEAFDIIINESNSRYPVYDEDIDDIIGILHFRDLITIYADSYKRNMTLLELKDEMLFEPHFIPETHNINALFKCMQSEKIHMAVVIDEYGQTAGIVTMEDILEEIVGNIMDEYDEEENLIQFDGENSYVMEGQTALDDIEDLLDIEFDNEDFDTLNGFMTFELGKIPEEDENFAVEYEGYIFRILKVEDKMISKVEVKKKEQDIKN